LSTNVSEVRAASIIRIRDSYMLTVFTAGNYLIYAFKNVERIYVVITMFL
jgi:hypothetical protein